MGSSQARPIPPSNFTESDWQAGPLVPYTQLKDPFYGSNFRLLTNRMNPALEVEQYDLVFNSMQEYTGYKKIMDWRNSQHCLVVTKHLRQIRRDGLCSSYHFTSVFIERHPIRLMEIEDISLEEGLYILYAALEGFQTLYQQYGYFEVEPQLVCFSKEGYVKVWVNKNLSKNYPEGVGVNKRHKTNQEFVVKVLTMIERLVDFEGKPSITDYLIRIKIDKPFENLPKVLQMYSKQHDIAVPRYLSTIRILCQKAGGRTRQKSQRVQERRRTAQRKDSNCQITEPVYNIAVSTPCRRSVGADYNPDRPNYFRATPSPTGRSSLVLGHSHSPSVSFHYKQHGHDSPKFLHIPKKEDLHTRCQTLSTYSSRPRQETQRSTAGVGQVFLANNDQTQIDPQIVEDLIKMASL